MKAACGGDVRMTRVEIFNVFFNKLWVSRRRYRALVFYVLHIPCHSERQKAKGEGQEARDRCLPLEPETP
jgi:hypothetical protein